MSIWIDVCICLLILLCSNIFSGFSNQISVGALLLVSDQPMIASGVKTRKSDQKVDKNFIEEHLNIGFDSLMEIKNNGESIKHLKYTY